MSKKYLIDDSVVFEPDSNHLYKCDGKDSFAPIKYEIGENSKDVLLTLIENSGQYVSAEELLEQVWRKNKNVEVDVTSVRQAVSKLRKILKLVEPEIQVIKTVSKKGYCLSVKVKPITDDLNYKISSGFNGVKVICKFAFFILLIFLPIALFIYSNKWYLHDSPVFTEIKGIDLYDGKVKLMQNKYHPIDKEVLPFFVNCLSNLGLEIKRIDNVVIYSTSERNFSVIVFFNDLENKALTYRFILADSFGKERVKCDF